MASAKSICPLMHGHGAAGGSCRGTDCLGLWTICPKKEVKETKAACMFVSKWERGFFVHDNRELNADAWRGKAWEFRVGLRHAFETGLWDASVCTSSGSNRSS